MPENLTQLALARRGETSPVMKAVADVENVSVDRVRSELAAGRAVLPHNPVHAKSRPGIAGRAFRTKVNANIGRSTEKSCAGDEIPKLTAALEAGADFVMDLSVGPDLPAVRQSILARCPVALGTVPIYEALWRAGGQVEALDAELLLQVIRDQARGGVDFMTLHAGLLREHVPLATRRVMGIVSRGGAILAEWMVLKDSQNPLLLHWDEVMDICAEYDVTVSLGDGLRPGCLADASDAAQFAELDELGKLVHRCRSRNVQVMVEGPGHVPFNQIQMNMEREAAVCDGAPFYVLGPIVIDVAPGYDHISSCIGATAAAFHGACLLCAVSPAEHLGLPDGAEVRAGVVAYRIAAHAADVARGLPGAQDLDNQMAHARAGFDWNRQFELALDGPTARARYHKDRPSATGETDHCTMCGPEFCAVRTSQRLCDHLRRRGAVSP
jgi:phosphomethylpyrimidine synthase